MISRTLIRTSKLISSLTTKSFVNNARFFSEIPSPVSSSPSSTDSTLKQEQSKLKVEENVQDLWAWIPPKAKREQFASQMGGPKIRLDIIEDTPLKLEEVKEFLEASGAVDVRIIKLHDPIVNLKHFIIGSVGSSKLIRLIGETLVSNMKDRGLHKRFRVPPVEGERDDDWQLVDCFTFAVHLMTPEARKAYDLEAHWELKVKPTIVYTGNDADMERQYERLCALYPPPDFEEMERNAEKRRAKREEHDAPYVEQLTAYKLYREEVLGQPPEPILPKGAAFYAFSERREKKRREKAKKKLGESDISKFNKIDDFEEQYEEEYSEEFYESINLVDNEKEPIKKSTNKIEKDTQNINKDNKDSVIKKKSKKKEHKVESIENFDGSINSLNQIEMTLFSNEFIDMPVEKISSYSQQVKSELNKKK